MIILPSTKQAQSYNIVVDLHSRTALRKKAASEHGITRRIIQVFATRTGNIDINFVDYTVARTFNTAIKQWYQSIQKNKAPKYIEIIQDKSEHVPSIFKIFTIITVAFVFYLNRDHFIDNKSSIDVLFSVGLVAFSAIYISGILAAKMGNFCEHAIDNYQAISGLRFNRGDNVALDEFKESNRKSILAMIISILGAIVINVFSGYLSKLLEIGSSAGGF